MEEKPQWVVCIFFCFINRNSHTLQENLFLPFAGKDSSKMTCALFFHELGIGNCLKLDFWAADNPIRVLVISCSCVT
jgi:hypothetical protein